MEIRHRLHEAGGEFSQSDGLAKSRGWPFCAAISAALHHAEMHLAIVAAIAQEIAAAGFAFDEADLRKGAVHGEIVVIRAKDAGADGVDDPQGLEANLGGDAAISHPEKPAAGFLLQLFV